MQRAGCVPAARAALLLAGMWVSAAAGAATRTDQILILGNVAGSQTVTDTGALTHAQFSFNDRGRGDHIVASWTLDAAGLPVAYQGSGNDYMKAHVEENFTLKEGTAAWHNRVEHGTRAGAAGAFYVPVNAPPEFLAVLARALLKSPLHRLALLPAGEASISPGAPLAADPDLVQYQITGLGFSPVPLWLHADGSSAAQVDSWFSLVTPSARTQVKALLEAQAQAGNAWSAALAQAQTHVPSGDLVIRGARLFDPRDLSVTPGMSVLVRGERIVRVAPDAALASPQGAEVIEAHGRFLMPGLWDNHQHFEDNTGALDLANGVTSARDMANDTEDFPARVARFDAGLELGPRVWKAGIIDGTGQFAGPTRMRVDAAAEAIRDVDWYADHGYGQIKIYSSVPPPLVPVIADEAHARGLRVSGHVPANMSAQQFVAAGADEIQHINFIALNFLFDTVKETRNMQRFTAVAEHPQAFDPGRPEVQQFIGYLKQRHTVLDPTVNVFEAMFCGDPAAVTPGLEQVAPRMPAQVRRSLLSEALVVPKGQEANYRATLPALLKLLAALDAAGITLIPGTDSMPGYQLHHELELYVRAGIPPAQVLRMATLTSAQVIGAGERGVIAAGKLADMILVNGDPSVRIADINNVDVVMKGGRLYDPARIEQALGIAPRAH